MITVSQNVRPIQNMGLVDRVLRAVIGGGVLGTIVFYYAFSSPLLSDGWEFLVVAVSLYPIWTAVTGWDPFYSLFDIKSGKDTGRNQCGTFPYQIEAALGRAPTYCDVDVERSLEACHREARERPRHEVWRVDQEPMIYPDDATLDEFIMRHMPPEKKRPVRGAMDKAA